MPKLINYYQSRFVGIDYRPNAVYLLEFGDCDAGVFVKQGTNSLKSIRTKFGPTIPNAAVAMRGAEVFFDYLTLPIDSSEDQTFLAIHQQAADVFHELPEEYYFDFYPVEVSKEQEGLQNFFWVAARKAQVDQLVQALDSANVRVEIVDVDYLAFQRAMRLLSDQLPKDIMHSTTALLNLDDAYSTFIVVRGEELVYARSDYQNNSILFDQRSHSYRESDALIADGVGARVSQFLDYYYASGAYRCDQIIVCGECTFFPELINMMSEKLSLPVIVGNPFLNLDFAADVDVKFLMASGPAFMRSSGLALRKPSDERH